MKKRMMGEEDIYQGKQWIEMGEVSPYREDR